LWQGPAVDSSGALLMINNILFPSISHGVYQLHHEQHLKLLSCCKKSSTLHFETFVIGVSQC